MEKVENRHFDLIAITFCSVILILALVVGHFRAVGNFDVETDFYGHYVSLAKDILAGQPYTYQRHPPGYMILLAGVAEITGDYFSAGKIISAVATALFGFVTYLLFKALFGKRVALASTLLLLITLIPYSFLAATDTVGALLMLIPLWILLRLPILTSKACLMAGILAGLAYLVRTNAAVLILGIGIMLFFVNLNNEAPEKRLVKVGVFLGGALLISFPWLLANWQINGSPIASRAYLVIAANMFHPAGDNLGTSLVELAPDFNSLQDVVLHDPPQFLNQYMKGLLINHAGAAALGQGSSPIHKIAGVGLLLVAGLGFVLLLRDFSRRVMGFFLVCFLVYLSLALVGFHFRFYLFLLPCLFVLVSYSLFQKQVYGALGYTRLLRLPVSWLMVMLLLIFLGTSSYHLTKVTLDSEPKYLLEMADFLRNRSSPQDIMIVRKPHLAYLANLQHLFPLEENADDYLTKAREINARYIVYSDLEARLWPGLSSLRDPDTVPDGLNVIYVHEPTHTLVYEIAGKGKKG